MRLFRQELGIPGNFPDMLIGILEIAGIASIEGLLRRFEHGGPGGLGPAASPLGISQLCIDTAELE